MGEQPSGAIERFMSRARTLAARGAEAPAREEIGALLAELARSGALALDDVRAGLHGGAAASTILASDPNGATLMLSRFPEHEPTPVHDHKSWGVAYVLRGRDRHIRWRRVDDGSAPGRARLVVVEDRELGEGEFVHWPEPPDDIHSQQGVGGPAYELVFFGRDPMSVMRRYFDPSEQTVREAMPR
jgi:predicted metal-dependent enzyme (double-stranded beta helix superfamily)